MRIKKIQIVVFSLSLLSSITFASNFGQFFSASSAKQTYVVKYDGVTRVGRFLGFKDSTAPSTLTNWIYINSNNAPTFLNETWIYPGSSASLYFTSANCSGTPLVYNNDPTTHAIYSGQIYQKGPTATYYSAYSYYSFLSGTCNGANTGAVWMTPMSVVANSPICGTGPCKLVPLTDP